MGKQQADITGQRFAMLVVDRLSDEKMSSGEKLWVCKCDCGGSKLVTASHLKASLVRSCGCLAKPKYGEANKTWKGYKQIGSAFWGGYQRGAEKRGIDFDVTIEEGWELFENQCGKCFFTGQVIEFSTNSKVSRHGTASLDRKDSTKGYTYDNCVWVHKDINRFKNNYSVDDFVKMCKMVASNFTKE